MNVITEEVIAKPKALIFGIRGFPNYYVTDEGNIYFKSERIPFFVRVPQRVNHGGYYVVQIKDNKGKRKTKRVHVLVWTTIMGKVPYGYQINHKFGLKFQNGLEDLELMTQEQNLKHSRDLGLRQKPKLERKLDEFQVLTLYTLKESHTRKSLVEYTGTTIRNVEMILAGQTWKWLFTQVMHEKSNSVRIRRDKIQKTNFTKSLRTLLTSVPSWPSVY